MTIKGGVTGDQSGALGPSFNINPLNTNIVNNGNAYKMMTALPKGLNFRQQGNDKGHYVLVPTSDMNFDDYIKLLKLITFEKAY
jgi:hypothetical protein